MKLKHLKALCKTLEDYENKCGDAEIDFLIDGKVYTPATFECNLDDRGNVWGLVITINLLVFTITSNTEKEYVSLFVAILLISSICATWLLISVAPKSDSVATQVINDFRNNKYEIYKTEIINSGTTYYYRLKQKE